MRPSAIIDFMPKVGDKIEFLTDGQTKRGPCYGSITAVNYTAAKCTVEHTNQTQETFNLNRVTRRLPVPLIGTQAAT